jgi:hypothetical protein
VRQRWREVWGKEKHAKERYKAVYIAFSVFSLGGFAARGERDENGENGGGILPFVTGARWDEINDALPSF